TTPGLQDFRESQIFFSTKGTKLQFKTNPIQPLLLDAMRNFRAFLDHTINVEFIYQDRFYVDLGKEICPPTALLSSQAIHIDEDPQTYLWRRCCLEPYIRELYDGRPPAKDSVGQRYYTQNMLYDACTLTSVTPMRSSLRKGGLIYSQTRKSVSLSKAKSKD
ncbi:hypothetical protein LTR93_012370, partial [Exophiala xenobiotica]